MSLLADSPPTYHRLLNALAEELADVGIESPRRTAEWIFMDVVGRSRAEIYAHSDRTVSRDDVAVIERMLERRRRREPLQYILGYTEFYGLRLKVSPAVLIPRPETERVVEHTLEKIATIEHPKVLDIGTGSGCIALAVAHERTDAEVIGCDNSSEALQVARTNARELGLTVDFRRADIASPDFLPGKEKEFDAVVSNPPYVTPDERDALEPEVREHEPDAALFTPGDPLHFYRIIADKCLRLLTGGGWLVFETHADYGSVVAELLERRGYEPTELHEDWTGRPRVAAGRFGS